MYYITYTYVQGTGLVAKSAHVKYTNVNEGEYGCTRRERRVAVMYIHKVYRLLSRTTMKNFWYGSDRRIGASNNSRYFAVRWDSTWKSLMLFFLFRHPRIGTIEPLLRVPAHAFTQTSTAAQYFTFLPVVCSLYTPTQSGE